MLTERQMWIKYTGRPKPQRREHKNDTTTCDFCRREKLAKERPMDTSQFELIECRTREEWLEARKEGRVGRRAAAPVPNPEPASARRHRLALGRRRCVTRGLAVSPSGLRGEPGLPVGADRAAGSLLEARTDRDAAADRRERRG